MPELSTSPPPQAASPTTSFRRRLVDLTWRFDPRVTAVVGSVWMTLRTRQRCLLRYEEGIWVHRYRDGVLVDVRPGSMTPAQQEREVRDVFLFDYVPQPGDTVVDVGAGVGSEVRVFSSLVGDLGRVVCVEADPVAARCLRRTIAENDLTNVTVVEAALSGTSGSVWLELDDSSYISNRLGRDSGGIEVSSRTLGDLLDSLGSDPVALVKMNIEGAEGEVLDPAPAQLSRVQRLTVSCHDFRAHEHGCTWQATSAVVTASLTSAGYTMRTRLDDPRSWVRYYLYASRPASGA
ncbi:FkbM family methyltransferase [uncultured Friedmanniella sp.]|uniref:FkbM family methyltransferase n=1 Tax=uncultured Friedmanniella sp. TaxID=335381 RepID=UPI0035CA7670